MWNELPEKDRNEYKNYILAFASLTEAFAQKAEGDEIPSPIINSKYQETVFQKAFSATVEDIGNSSFDASVIIRKDNAPDEKFIVGIKTFGTDSDSSQKIAQFKRKQQESWLTKIDQLKENAKGLKSKEEIDRVNHDIYLDLAMCISKIRNERIRSSIHQLKGFEYTFDDTDFTVAPDHVGQDIHMHSIYHTLQPSPKGNDPKIYVREDSYNTIDINNITICGCTAPKYPANFEFNDGHHKYKYTPADSQLYMDFEKAETLDIWDVKYVDDAYSVFEKIGHNIYIETDTNKTNTIIEEYIWPIVVKPYSGFNSFYSTGSKSGKKANPKKWTTFSTKYSDFLVQHNNIRILIERYMLSPDIDNKGKERLRNDIIEILKNIDNQDFSESVYKLLYRPENELYIPVPKSSSFHNMHPDFFGKNIGKEILSNNKAYCKDHPFTLRFEPSGNTISAYITQENGKSIQSTNKQSILGEWILRGVFQLKKHEQLTQERLDELEINALRLYKTLGSDEIHIEFIWINDTDTIDPTKNRINHNQ